MKILTPNFKIILSSIGIVFVLLSISLFAKGLKTSMMEFKVPDITLNSEHYLDALKWVYIHQIFIGGLIFFLGQSVTNLKHQRSITVFILIAISYYVYLDFRTSDSSFGNGLYQGEQSIIPGIINVVISILLISLLISLNSKKKTNSMTMNEY